MTTRVRSAGRSVTPTSPRSTRSSPATPSTPRPTSGSKRREHERGGLVSGPELDGKVAIVTGGASGLGRAMVELFVEEGARVVIADVNAEGGTALAAQLGDAAVFQPTDVADAAQIQAAVDIAVARFGGLHVMCNNAGIGGSPKSFLGDDFADFDRVMAVNIYGVLIGTQRAARHMAEHGGGAIVNTTSIGGINAGGGVMAYRASKAAVIHLTRSL